MKADLTLRTPNSGTPIGATLAACDRADVADCHSTPPVADEEVMSTIAGAEIEAGLISAQSFTGAVRLKCEAKFEVGLALQYLIGIST